MRIGFGGLAVLACAVVFVFSPVAKAADANMLPYVADAWSFANSRLYYTMGYAQTKYGEGNMYKWFPRETTVTAGSTYGQWVYKDANTAQGWMSGQWTGSLWWDWKKTGDANTLQAAISYTNGIEFVKNNTFLDIDIGFRFMGSFYLANKLLTDAADPGGVYRAHAHDVLLDVAGDLDTYYNMNGIPAGQLDGALPPAGSGWNQPYGVNIDAMMNIQLMFEGWSQSGRPTSGTAKTWYDHAVSHSMKTLEQNMRFFSPTDLRFSDNGSTYHTVNHNNGANGLPADGNVYMKRTLQGFGDETTWSRGQTWAMYGFADAFYYTQSDSNQDVPKSFLYAARLASSYYISHLPVNSQARDSYNYRAGDFVPPSDFDAALGEPNGPWNDYNNDKVYGDKRAGTHAFVARDSFAAAAAASALLRMSTLDPDANLRTMYFDTAEDILWCLMTYDGDHDGKLDYIAKDSNHMGILASSSGSYGSAQNSSAGGDYYFLEALSRYEAIVPEPASLAILATSLILLPLRRRRLRRA
jgi:unsaturated chondroitin disaccharide hydrolase